MRPLNLIREQLFHKKTLTIAIVYKQWAKHTTQNRTVGAFSRYRFHH